MKNFILAPDSFKGTMSAQTVCSIWSEAIKKHIPDAKIRKLPLADGGEGMVEAFLGACGGQRKAAMVSGPAGERVDAVYGILPDGTAVVEMAACAGLTLIGKDNDPRKATTYGVGELLLHAANDGAHKIILGLGGSATNDCGIGMAAALGYRFYDRDNKEMEPLAKNMVHIDRIEKPEIMPDIEVLAACDVDNPLYGEHGATYTFGPQKGVKGEMLAELDAGLKKMAKVIDQDLHVRIDDAPGAGAAGGLGGGVLAFLNGTLEPGIDLLLDVVHFEDMLDNTDMVFVGEGRMDWQTAHGKAPVGISRRAKKRGIPCIALNGMAGKGAEAVYDEGICALFSAGQGATDMSEIIKTCEQDMSRLADAVVRMLCL
ncbi:MAG: glycerate kinase [Christensenella sp.]|uniref:glycerate kinase family protein n=1 Tax=Christensenella sp. TaxID=1935934 RepID=UPI002B2005EB|nr:glycerate kinase [Christensenella sp.]MEA5003605.1 glycerate kinase [Christensenella sp.]